MKNGLSTSNGNDEIEYTGRYLVLLPEENSADHVKNLKKVSGLNLASSTDFKDEIFTAEDIANTDGIVLDKLGIAIVNSVPEQLSGITALGTESNPVIIEPERVVYALNGKLNANYLRGYVDAVNNMASELLIDENQNTEFGSKDSTTESVGSTWGLKATNVIPTILTKKYSGAGIKVAVLDTGFDFAHPDFSGRTIIQQSFISGQTAADGHGHGTHCVGTSCGPLNTVDPAQPRYGIAYNASIYVGKVLSNAGSGADGGILAGINWAISNGCAVISMSLGAPTSAGGYSTIFENAAARALAAGSLIVAAAGNESTRPSIIKPVSHPANCPSIMAVGAVDVNMAIASFSCGGVYTPYGSVDIAGPGVAVFSSTKLPAKYATWSGTSMATPHVAGIAALWAESSANLRGAALWNKLIQTAKRLNLPARDVGVGLVQAPSKPMHFPFPQPIPVPHLPLEEQPA